MGYGMGGGEQGGSNEVLWVAGGWVGGEIEGGEGRWVGRTGCEDGGKRGQRRS